ncbi:MAG: phenylacetate--CoA ligase family protein, partial [Gammaproteobacteria bacterium]
MNTAEDYLANQAQLKFAKLRGQIAYVFENSEFYRSRLQAAGVSDPRDVDSMEAFRALPVIMTKADHRSSQADSLARLNHSFGMHLCAPLEEVIHVAATSGTSGDPTFYTFTRKDLQTTQQIFGRLFRMATIRPGDTVLSAFGLSMWLAGVTVIQALEAYGARPIGVGAEAGIAKILRYIQLTRPRVLMATPSLASHLIECSEAEIGMPVGALGIEVLACAGEPGAGIPAVRQRLMDAYG